ncbi:3943_t:CDS:2 [Funneliformis geosporum]|nr:3943_t:CDS:2 [Funneliformis geosporum]
MPQNTREALIIKMKFWSWLVSILEQLTPDSLTVIFRNHKKYMHMINGLNVLACLNLIQCFNTMMNYNNVISWGLPALVKKQMQRNGNYKRPVELFKLCLCQPHPLPPLLDYKKAITDYFREIGKEMKKTIATWYPGIDFLKNVLLVLTKFHEGKTALRSEMLCGSTFVDKEFIEYLSRKLGNSAMEMFRENHYEQMQFLIQEFCKSCKWPFTGEKQDFSSYELDLDVSAPMLKKYITNDMIEKIEEDEWIIEIGFNDIKSMFDPVVEKILNLIHKQLNSSLETCSAMFLIGGFSESKYLQRRIKENFAHRVHTILVPGSPIVTIELGAVIYGLSSRGIQI